MSLAVYLLLALAVLLSRSAEGLTLRQTEQVNRRLQNDSSKAAEQQSRRSFLHHHIAAMTVAFLPKATMAYERRDVGDGTRSATTAAFNDAAYATNNRLEASGFKLDTREEEQARLSQAMASFSYESSTPRKKSGYGSTSASTGAPSKAPTK